MAYATKNPGQSIGKRARILLITDTDDNEESLFDLLSTANSEFELEMASSFRAGYEDCYQNHFDCVVVRFGAGELDLTVKKTSLLASDFPVIAIRDGDDASNKSTLLLAGAQESLLAREASSENFNELIGRSIHRFKYQQGLIFSASRSKNLEAFAQSNNLSFLVFDAGSLEITVANSGFCRSTGYTEEQLVGQPLTRLLTYTRDELLAVSDSVGAPERSVDRIYAKIRCRDDSHFPCEIDLEPVAGNLKKDIMAVIHNIADLEASSERSAQIQRMQAISNLLGGIAHDYNNLLTTVLGGLDKLADSPKSDDQVMYYKLAVDAAGKASELSEKLVSISGKKPGSSEVIQLDKSLQDISRIIVSLVPDNINLCLNLEETGVFVKIDPAGLESAMLSIVSNSKEAMLDGGEIRITLGSFSESGATWQEAVLPPGDYALITVHDNGAGMEGSTLTQAFDPYFTTKVDSTERGMGLAMVRAFASRSGGAAMLYGEEGAGTTFKMYLPLIEKLSTDGADGSDQKSDDNTDSDFDSQHGNLDPKVILLVEDNEMIKKFTASILNEAGYSVFQAGNADEALNISKENSPDLLFTDVVMPGSMNGVQLAKELRKSMPSLPCLLASGYTEDIGIELDKLPEKSKFVQKPYRESQLLQIIADLLDQ